MALQVSCSQVVSYHSTTNQDRTNTALKHCNFKSENTKKKCLTPGTRGNRSSTVALVSSPFISLVLSLTDSSFMYQPIPHWWKLSGENIGLERNANNSWSPNLHVKTIMAEKQPWRQLLGIGPSSSGRVDQTARGVMTKHQITEKGLEPSG